MRLECNGRVCRIFGGKICCEVIETTIVRFPDKGNLLQNLCRGIGVFSGNVVDKAEAILAL